MSLTVKDESMLVQYSEIWNKINLLTGRKRHRESEPFYDDKYIKTKVKMINGVIHTNVHDKKIRIQNTHYICLAVITGDSVMRKDNTLKYI